MSIVPILLTFSEGFIFLAYVSLAVQQSSSKVLCIGFAQELYMHGHYKGC